MVTLAVSSPAMAVGRLVVRPAVMVEPEWTLAEVARVLREENVSSALVGGPGAIVTERDLAGAWERGMRPDDPIGPLATLNPVTIRESMPIAEAAATMLNQDIRHVVVVTADGDIGVVSLRALMAVLLQAVQPELWLATLRVSFSEPPELFLG